MKYRIWDKIKNKFNDDIFITQDGSFGASLRYIGRKHNDFIVNMCSLVKDDRGQDIYEGDVVRIEAENYIVTYENGKFLLQNDEQALLYDLYEYYSSQIKKLGNIYEK